MIYLDNASTTQVLESVNKLMFDINAKEFFNPSASYFPSQKVAEIIENSRSKIAKTLNAHSDEIYFTGSATEANNWAIFNGFKMKNGNIVVSAGEHPSVHECCSVLKNRGLEVRFSPLNSNGCIDLEKMLDLVDEKTCLLSVIHASNESGIINDLSVISNAAKKKNRKLIIHSDGVQAFLKTENNLQKLGVDLYSISGHKVGATKGIGALYVKKDLKLSPYIYGGGQEKNMRSGTENTAAIAGFALAAEEFKKQYSSVDFKKYKRFVIDNLTSNIKNIKINSDNKSSLDSILSVSIAGIQAEVLQRILSTRGVLVGLGSACSSRKSGNRVLAEMGLTSAEILGSVRISFGINNTFNQIEDATKILIESIKNLKEKTNG